jgi:predicted nucleic acid-binding protein
VKVISNASPLIALSAIGKLELLHELYGTVFIPPAVYDEVAVGQHKQRVIIDDFKKSWLKVKPVQSKVIVDTLKIELDAGEAEVIALAIDEKADLILIDERIGRRTAERLGVLFLGTLGILTQAKQKNLIPTLKPILVDLMTKAGFYMTPKLIAQLLSTVGET